jgi:catechol 2,3-dioxygenase-like lactoylglutathione lyase family enzyme
MALNHVALTVSDRERSAAFYAEHFGLADRVHDEPLILSGRGGGLLALNEGEVPPELPPSNHFGFGLDDPAEVRAARERFAAAGLEETEWQDDAVAVRVQVRDPDGYRVELYTMVGGG